MKVMEALLARKPGRHTWRFLILPETIGSVAYLSHHEDQIERMKGGLFLEMLGRRAPHALQLSFSGETEIDRCFRLALKTHDREGWFGPYRSVIGNDERQFNAPGVRVPMLSLSRVLPRNHQHHPYREYHSSEDTPDRVAWEALDESVELVLRMVDTVEQNGLPANLYKGEVFCSRFGLHIDPYNDPEGNNALFSVMDLIDGTRSLAEIAEKCNLPFEAVLEISQKLQRHGLVRSSVLDH
jgi:aminopeptidase-like protein